MIRSTRRILAGAFMIAVCGSGSAAAQELPEAKALLAKYHTAMNATAFSEVKSMHSKGELTIPAQGISAEFEAFTARPNRSGLRISLAGIGEFRVGVSDGKAWSSNPLEGSRLYSGAELVQSLDEADFNSTLRPEGLIASMSTVERTTMAGRECYKVKLVWKSGRETFDCYDVETGLRVATQGRAETNAGSGESITLYEDYKEFGGMKMPTRITIRALGAEQVVTISEVKLNEVQDSAFEPPAQVRALMGG